MISALLQIVIGAASVVVGLFFLITVVKWSQFGFSDLFWFFFVAAGTAWVWNGAKIAAEILRRPGKKTAS